MPEGMKSELYEGLAALDERTLREKAWLGDAILTLHARHWLNAQGKALDNEAFTRMTANSFLSAIGQPTKLEARIGLLYESGGLPAAFSFIDTYLLPIFEKQEANRAK